MKGNYMGSVAKGSSGYKRIYISSDLLSHLRPSSFHKDIEAKIRIWKQVFHIPFGTLGLA